MFNGIFNVGQPENEPVLNYAPGSPEKAELKAKLSEMLGQQIEVPMLIGGEAVNSGNKVDMICPHNHKHVLGQYHQGNALYVEKATDTLRHAAGNFYVNDKPTGAVVGQQPFGGGRASGTNDKAGSLLNLVRWVTPRTIKETFLPPTDFRYPYMAEE